MREGRSVFWPEYRTVWRWHMLAGLFCLPFVALLAITGAIYLFKPQVDDLIDWRYDHLAVAGAPGVASAEVRAALGAVPGSRFMAYELPRPGHGAARVIVLRGGEAIRVYIDPSSLAVLGQVAEEARFERLVFRLHGQLLLGNVGSVIMEMVASWTIVLIVTGLYLWWPRGRTGLAGIVYPRLGLSGRARWRDLHAVTGLWLSLVLALFLVSGLPWSFVWGHALQSVEQRVGRLMAVQDWEIGAVPVRDTIAGHPVAPHAGMGSMADMPGMDMGGGEAAEPDALAGVDAVVATGVRLGLPAPVLVTPPAAVGAPWQVRSDTQDRPKRASVRVGADGTVLSRQDFAGKGLVDRAVGYGVAAHEGQLFGWPNQLLNLLVAGGLATMSIAATILWSRRRPPGGWGVPAALPGRRVGVGAVVAMVVLGVLLPELGGSLLLLAVAAWAMGRRVRPEGSESI
ncbi:PepSY-associated TM helix domain-containing protein [Gluconacetobacter takamatsuzukensis]|uniref:PepSY domain-containing protein n=1 Tax=Gluconacetobacter takamatsuzukensis TaxID=1286190 RepID=A0A7W4PRE7_9PROT|nr:PepSY domain-containing protein [Gluconacetobacter takamatsuzukensis]MBB2203816.1 PepSY domain-containing protein [Gluconacetobacter takamatsuzukensis]